MTAQWLTMDDGAQIYVHTWAGGTQPPRAILQLAHGMAEHILRYDAFATYMADRGFYVIGSDHRGHGRTGEKAGKLGYFGPNNGFDRVVDDLLAINRAARACHPGIPLFLLGHSMGSMLARRYIQLYDDTVQGVIAMGTAGNPGPAAHAGKLIARWQMWRGEPHLPSPLLNKLSFGAYNKGIPSPKTPFDWLSTDDDAVAKYVADPLCGFVCSAGFYFDLLTGMQLMHDDRLIAGIRKDLPLLIISGDADPVGGFGAGVGRVAKQYERHGLTEVTTILFPGARHELLNETNRMAVYTAVHDWLDHTIKAAEDGIGTAG